LLEVLMDAAVMLTGAERGFLLLDEHWEKGDIHHDGPPALRVAVARNIDRENLRKPAHKLSHSIASEVFATGSRMLTTDAKADPRYAGNESVHAGNLRSILCVPLELGGRPIGVLYADNRFTSGAFTAEHAALLEALAAQAAIAIHTARLLLHHRATEEALARSKAEIEALNARLRESLEHAEDALVTARQALDAERLAIARRSDYSAIKGESPEIFRLFRLMDRVRDHDFPVVIVGESGTGKELVARAIHFTGARKQGPFAAINCGALPETLLESELFGHVRGAFTGAVAERRGLFEAADRGTLLLDEIGEMPLAMQVKLLRVLQTGEIQRVGDNRVRKVDMRVLAATHRDLGRLVSEQRFREDLLYRLRVVELPVPPLRQRTADLPLLVEYFVARNREAGLGRVARVSPRAMQALVRHPWPGNVRQLETVLKNACLFAESEVLESGDVTPLLERSPGGEPARAEVRPEGAAEGTLAEIERSAILARLAACDGNKSRAAQSLGIDRGTLYNKLRDYGVSG
jgi:transcriptional regulator with GAF, ATPase, and Fis domain